ncbi:helix-turn-helix domain-containing protein [Streptomyces sp. D2-8]|uniref:helix-turn-helix transcriptional regulator n=1 Tax=Streptomyces sp. D2-8 TaxID=2707767 RepID=UPI0020BE9CB3|nr:helix-turn-helix transcriptional regulator [Streptomyces sp. D2-8]MCK8438769.1 helix-turn-helix domain-containing protein [Streptomyces sp. D2-8]
MNPAQGRPLKPLSAETDPRIAAVAEALRDLRLRAGLSLRQLAVKCNYSPATLSIAASGKSLPRWEVVEAYVRGCTSDEDEQIRIRNLWNQAHAVQEGARRAPNPAPSEANNGRDGVRRPAHEATAHEPDNRRAWRTRRPAGSSFADAVTQPARDRGPAPDASASPRSPVPPARRAGVPQATVRLRDPGDSLPKLVHQAHLISNNSAYTALDLCSTPEHFIELLERLRHTNGLSLRELSDRCKRYGYPVSKSTLHDLLKGQELPSTELLHAFLHSCGCDADDWMAWHQTRTRLKIAQLLTRTNQPLGLLRRDRFTRTAALTLLTLILLIAQVIVTLTLTK